MFLKCYRNVIEIVCLVRQPFYLHSSYWLLYSRVTHTHIHTHTHVYIYIHIYWKIWKHVNISWHLARAAGAVEYNDCISTSETPGYDIKKSDGEVPVMLELWEMRSASLLSSLQGPLRPGVVAPDRVLSMGQIQLNCALTLNWIV